MNLRFAIFCHTCGAAFGIWLTLLAPVSARAATFSGDYTEVVYASGLSRAVAMEFAPDGRLFVCQQSGELRVIENGALLSTPFVELDVNSDGERGLLGIAFDPDFAVNQYLYVYYTAKLPAVHNRVSRFTANGNVAVTNSETVILELDNLSGAANHNGGAIHFGADGKLYIAAGDNANGANAQTSANLLGKVLRINSDGSIPENNPFYGTETGRNRAIWALGFRNPFTFAVQPGTGRIFVNDVGQGSREEINELVRGANYGWPACEGACNPPNADFRNPIFAYQHGGGSTYGNSIAGGAFYNPPTNLFPETEIGVYYFADFVNGWIRRLDPDNGNHVTGFATGLSNPVDLKVGPDGRLYYLARGNGRVMAIYHVHGFADVAGSYNGLFYFYEPSGELNRGASGFFNLVLRPNGNFSARLQQGAKRSSWVGKFDLTDSAINSVVLFGSNNVRVELVLDRHETEQITGTIVNGFSVAELIAGRATFDTRKNPATNYAIRYTLLIPGSPNTPDEPAGDSVGNFTIDTGGSVRLTGTLADGSPMVQKVPLSKDGTWPFYVSLYGGRGHALGWIGISNLVQPDLGGLVSWRRPAGPRPKIHTNGFTLDSMLVGSSYHSPGTNTIFEPTNAVVIFSEGNLGESVTNDVSLARNARVTYAGTNRLRLTLAQRTGRLSGSVLPPGKKRSVSFKGAILQNQGYGGGFFLGTNESGRVYFSP